MDSVWMVVLQSKAFVYAYTDGTAHCILQQGSNDLLCCASLLCKQYSQNAQVECRQRGGEEVNGDKEEGKKT